VSGGIDEAEFRQMTNAVMGIPESSDAGDTSGSARRSGSEGGGVRAGGGGEVEPEKDLGRSFKKRQQSVVMAVMTSAWVLAPTAMIMVVLVFSYRSGVRRSQKPSRWASAGYTVNNRAAKNK